MVGRDNVLQTVKEPLVNLGEFMNLIDSVTGAHSLGNHEDTPVGRFTERLIHIGNLELLVSHIAMSPLPDHTKTLLDSLLERASDSHDLADTLHAGADLARYAVKLGEVPTRNLADNIVKRRLEESRCCLGNRVLKVEQTIAETKFRSHESKRITCSLGCQCRRPRQSGIDLDHPVIHGIRVVSILHITLTHNTYMAHDADRKFTKEIVVLVRQSL